jgi:putrescine transport system permease protein
MMSNYFQKHHWLKKTLIGVPYFWCFLFVLIPFIIILKISISESFLGTPPYKSLFQFLDHHVVQFNINLENYQFILSDVLYRYSLWQSVKIASMSTLGCLLLGYPMAYYITRQEEYLQTRLLLFILVPFWTSFLLRVYAWIGILSPTGFINTLLLNVGIIAEPLTLLYTPGATIIGMVYCYLPFMILPLYASLSKFDPSLLEAAADLGSKPLRSFLQITLPLSKPGILGGCTLVFIPSVGEFVIPELLGGNKTLMLGKVIWIEFFTNRDWPVAASLAILMMVFLVVPIALLQRKQKS